MLEQKTKTVFNLKITMELMKLGFNPIKVELNNERDNYLVFKFLYSDELIDAFEKIKAEHLEMRLVE